MSKQRFDHRALAGNWGNHSLLIVRRLLAGLEGVTGKKAVDSDKLKLKN